MSIQQQLILWLVLLSGMIAFPVGYLVVYAIRRVILLIQSTKSKLEELKALDRVKEDIMKQHDQELKKQDEIRTSDAQSIEVSQDNDTASDDANKPTGHHLMTALLQDQDVKEQLSPEQLAKEASDQLQIEHKHHKKNKFLDKIIYEAQVFKERGQLDLYEKKIIEWLAMDIDHFELNRMLADLYFHTGQYKKALTLLKKVIEWKPDDHKALRQIGEIYLQRWQFDTAQMLIDKALQYKPTNPRYYVSMVEIKYNTDQLDQAISLMEKVVKLRPSNVDYLNAIAKLYEEYDDPVNAKKYYYKVLELEPTNEKAKIKMRKL